MTKLIIGLTGKIAAGKGTVAAYLSNRYQAEIFGFSTPLRDILTRLYQDATRPRMASLSSLLRELFGQDLLSRTITLDLQKTSSAIAVLDGIRRLPDISQARQLPNFQLIQVVTDEKIRYERLTKRQQNPDDVDKTFAEFLADEQKEADRSIPEIMALADYRLDNNGDLDNLHRQIDELMGKLKI